MSENLENIVEHMTKAAEADLEKNSAFRASVLLRNELSVCCTLCQVSG